MRRTVLLLYALLFANELVLMGVVPLVPLFERELGLTTVQSGAYLAASGVAVLVTAIPAGLAADRFGARRLTILAAAGLAVTAVAQGLAPDFTTLLAARVAFGVASTTIWTAGLSWLAEAAGERRTTALGATMTMAGLGAAVGPAFVGVLAERSSPLLPLAIVGVAAAALTVALALLGRGGGLTVARDPVARTLARGLRERIVATSVVLMALGGLTGSVFSLLGSLQLADNGLSEGAIGVVFSTGAAVFILAAALVARRGERTARVAAGGAATLVLACLLLPLVASTSTATLIGFVLLRAPALAIMFGISYPLGAKGAARAGVGRGAVMGLLNLSWGAATAVGPLAGGAIAESAGESWAYGALAAMCFAGSAWMLRGARIGDRVRAAAARAR